MPRKIVTQASYADPVSTMMASLLPVHAAVTPDWLVDAAATAAERAVGAPFCLVYFEDQDGRLDPKAPASDLRRRSIVRLSDALGYDVLRRKLDPRDMPLIAEAIDASIPLRTATSDFFASLAGAERAGEAARRLTAEHTTFAPLVSAGERIGALLLLHVKHADEHHAKLLADHVACAAVNLRNAQTAREQGVIDVVRSVFDSRKLESELQRELGRAERYKRPVSLVVVEATNLRLLRERFGEFLTDRLLQRLGESLAQQARDIDVIGAYKESGYTMILTEASPEGAALAAKRLLEVAQEARVDGEHVPGLELHLVAGHATCPADGGTSDALFAAAERRMYGASWQAAS